MLKGMKRGDISINYREVKGRKKPCLTIEEGNHMVVAASFVNKKMAELFFEAFDYMFNDGDFTLKKEKEEC